MLRASWNRVFAGCTLLLVIGVVALWTSQTAQGQRRQALQPVAAPAGPHYSVVITEGHNLLVTDNGSNHLYFYTIDKDKPIGSPLKLRASIDLAKVGEPEITIQPHNLEGAK
jgi:hypothetical protein